MWKRRTGRILVSFIFVLISVVSILLYIGCGGSGTSSCGEGAAPAVTSTIPVNGSVEVHPAMEIVVNFSSSMDISTVVPNTSISSAAGSEVTFNNDWNTSSTQMVLIPVAPLDENETYTVTIGPDAMNTNNVPMTVGYAFSFGTGDVAITSVNEPSQMETGVPTDTKITVSFSEAMDEESVEDNFSLSRYADTIDFIWNGTSTSVTASLSASLQDDRTYQITILPNARDNEGTVIGSVTTFVFSTGSEVASGAISGVVSDDDASDYDDRMNRTFVGLYWYDFSLEQDGNPVLAKCDSAGAYHFSYLDPGDYYIRAFQDSNGDGLVGDDVIRSGDAVGIYESFLNPVVDAVTVSLAASTGVDFQLFDPEAISGTLGYAGAYTAAAFAAPVYARIYRNSALVSEAPANSPAGTAWTYDVNPMYDERDEAARLSGNYSVSAFIDFNGNGQFDAVAGTVTDYGEPVGFYGAPVQIRDAGDDESGVDFFLYDTITIAGTVSVIDSISDPAGAAYDGGSVTVAGIPGEASTVSTGAFTLDMVPVGFEEGVAIRVLPSEEDSNLLMASNSKFIIFDTGDAVSSGETFGMPLLSVSAAVSYGDLCDIERVKFTDGLVVGQIHTSGGSPVTGIQVEIIPGNDVFYIGNGASICSTEGSTLNTDGGFQFVIFNNCLDTYKDGSAEIVVTGCTADNVTIPIREGELTYVEIVCDP